MIESRFILRNIAVANFYLYAQDFPIQGDGNTVFLGGNGSGKSMLLDAIQIVMTGMNKRYLDLNSRVSEGGKSTRTVRESCLGLLDDGEGYERDNCLTYIALGFESDDGSQKCTAGVCIEAKESIHEEHVLGLFVVEDAILQFDDFVQTDAEGFEEKLWSNFLDEQRRLKRNIVTYPRQNNKKFLRHLYSIINANARGTQLDPDRARAAMRQALSFDIGQITSVTNFVKRFLLDDLPIDIETFQARYTTWRDMQRDIARVEEEIKTVETITALSEKVMQDQYNSRLWSYGSNRAEYDRYGSIIQKQQQELRDMEEQSSSIDAYKSNLESSIDDLRDQLESVKREISGIPAYEQVKQAQLEEKNLEAERKSLGADAKPLFDGLTALRESLLSVVFPSERFPALKDFANNLVLRDVHSYDTEWPKQPLLIETLIKGVPTLSDYRAYIDGNYQEAASDKAQLDRANIEVERHLTNLRAGRSIMTQQTQDFLADMMRMKIPAQTLSELCDVAPAFAEWRGIVEAVLGDWCDVVIIEPSFMEPAFHHFDQSYKGGTVKLIQSENTLARDLPARTGSLAETVTTDDIHARAFLNARLSGIQRARSADEIRCGDRAASVDGKFAHGKGIEYRRIRPLPRLGQSVRQQQLQELTTQKAELTTKLQIARDKERRLLAVSEALKRANEVLIVSRDAGLKTLEELRNTDKEIERAAEQIRYLEAQLPDGLIDRQKNLENEIKTYLQELKEETEKEKKLIADRAQREEGLKSNRVNRDKAAQQALTAIPKFESRRAHHSPPIGLEVFMFRARRDYARVLAEKGHPAHVRNLFEGYSKERQQSQGNVMRLCSAIQQYVESKPDQHPGFEWTRIVEREETSTLFDWIGLRHRHLTETVLRQFRAQVDRAVIALVETMMQDFLSRLSANIETVDRVKDDLNRALRGSVFMGEVYQIRQERDQSKDTIRYLIDRLDVITPKAALLMQNHDDPHDPDQVNFKALIEILTRETNEDSAHKRLIQELSDYRNYFRFSIDICDPENALKKLSDLEQRRGKASGGQKFVPFYICLGVAAAAAYRNHLGDVVNPPPQSALVLMDEAFEKLDPENIYKIIRFYQSLGLQLIMAAPKTHQALYQETFNTLISIIRTGRAIQAVPQHFLAPAHDLLRNENPMHKPRSHFEEIIRREHETTAR